MVIFTRHPRTFANDYCSLPETIKEEFVHWNHPDARITPAGRAQAIRASYEFKEWLDKNRVLISLIAVSPSKRTLEYANILLPIINCDAKVKIEPIVRENVTPTSIINAGLSYAEIRPTLEKEGWFKHSTVDLSSCDTYWRAGEESEIEFNNRLQEAWRSYMFQDFPKDEAVLIVSHWLFGNLFLERPDCIQNCEFIQCHFKDGQISSKTIVSTVSTAG